MTMTDLHGVLERLRVAERLLVTSHVNPDGDAVGSILAMDRLLAALGKHDVTCVLPDPVPRTCAWLPGAGRIVDPDRARPPFDTAVIVDVSARDRIGRAASLLLPDTHVVVVDHHLVDRPEADTAFVDASYAAVGEIVADLFDAAGLAPDADAALCAYVALATDTGGFRFSNVTPRAHRVAARLVETGIDVAETSARLFDTLSVAKFRLMARFTADVRLAARGRVAHGALSARDMADCEAAEEDVENIINLARNMDGVDVAILLRETEPSSTKVSLRARKGINSVEMLRPFGGGGHAAASGATLPWPLDEARARIVDAVCAYLGEPA